MNKPALQYPARLAVLITGHRLIVILFTAMVLLSGCKGCKKTTEHVETHIDDRCHLDNKSPRTLIALMKQHEFDFKTVSLKLDCEFQSDSAHQSFDMTVRIRKDSLIWINITDPVVGISVARAVITPDSVKFIKLWQKNECFQGDFAYINKLLHAELDYEMVQSLFVGNSATFYEEDEKLKSSITEDCKYLLSTVRHRKLRRAEEGRTLNEPYETITLDSSSFKIVSILYKEFSTNRSFGAVYSDFTKVGDAQQAFAQQADFTISAEKSISVNIRYKKVTLNKTYDYPFSIPNDCEPIIFKESH